MGKVSGSVKKKTNKPAYPQRCDGWGEAQIMPSQAAPRSTTGTISPSKAHLDKPREWHKLRTPKQQPTSVRLFQHNFSPSVCAWSLSPWVTGNTSPQYLSRLRGLQPRGGTHYEMHGKHSSGLHRIHGMFRGRTKGGKRQRVRWFKGGKNAEVGWGGKHKYWSGQYTCLVFPCIWSAQSVLPSY